MPSALPSTRESGIDRPFERFLDAARSAFFEKPVPYWSATVLLVALLATSILGRFPINHDIASHLEFTGRILDGERLYTDVFEPNPPLIYWLYMPLILGARLVGVAPYEIVLPCLFAVLLLCAGVTYAVARRVELPASLVERRLFLWLVLAASTLVAGYEFGQRDPLMSWLTLPYVVAAAGRARRTPVPLPLALAAGVLGAIGFALKPFFAVLWLLTEGYLLLVRKERAAFFRAENVAVMSLIGAYGAWIVLGTDYIRNLRLVALSYRAYDVALGDVLTATDPTLWALALALLVLLREPDTDRALHVLLGIAVLSFLVTALVQRKGWDYHVVPVSSAAWMAIGVAVLALSRAGDALRGISRLPASGYPVAVGATLLAVVAVNVQTTLIAPDYPTAAYTRAFTPVLRRLAPGGKVALFGTSIYPAFPAITYVGARNVLTLGVWPLPSIYAGVRAAGGRFPYHERSAMEPVERLVVDRAVRDLERARPQALIFDRQRQRQAFGDSSFDYEEYFSRDPRFRALLAAYVPVVEVGGFRFYARRPGA